MILIFEVCTGYLLHGKRLKHEKQFRWNEIIFYAEIQRKFTYLTSEASSIIEFELNFGILIKDFIESKKFMFDDFMYDINQRRKIIYQEKSVQ